MRFLSPLAWPSCRRVIQDHAQRGASDATETENQVLLTTEKDRIRYDPCLNTAVFIEVKNYIAILAIPQSMFRSASVFLFLFGEI